ncbi:cysteine hydrolase [Ralstonia sp. UBA689]|uniref:cysteine hydrolase n=1 Tax=Ralstonia sp. UBA689 TaxID=1947373 RepID=UPI0025D876EF|nr:cysteine hydrolase family protein [Ralstonia sp. UBA689]
MTNQPLLEKSRTALVFIEFQREWLATDGVLFNGLVQDKEAFLSAVGNAERVLTEARQQGWTIVHAGLDLRSDAAYRLFSGGENVLGLRAAIPRAGTWTGAGAAFVPPFVPQGDEFVSQGRSGASVLRNSTLDPFLRNNRIDSLVLMGFATHVCVESTLREAHDMGINCWVVTDGCAAFTEGQHNHVLNHVVHHFGAGIESEALVQRMHAANSQEEATCSS